MLFAFTWNDWIEMEPFICNRAFACHI